MPLKTTMISEKIDGHNEEHAKSEVARMGFQLLVQSPNINMHQGNTKDFSVVLCPMYV